MGEWGVRSQGVLVRERQGGCREGEIDVYEKGDFFLRESGVFRRLEVLGKEGMFGSQGVL